MSIRINQMTQAREPRQGILLGLKAINRSSNQFTNPSVNQLEQSQESNQESNHKRAMLEINHIGLSLPAIWYPFRLLFSGSL